jgi:hypothetical protein
MSIATDQVKFSILCIEHGCAKIDFNKVAAEYTRLFGQDLTAGAASKRLARLKIKVAETGGTETSPKKIDVSPRKMDASPRRKEASPKKKVKEDVKEEVKVAVKEKVKEEIKKATPTRAVAVA